MAAIFYCPHAAGICTLAASHTGRIDGIVVVAGAFLLGHPVVVFKEIVLEFFVLHNIGKTETETRISLIAKYIHSF